MRSLTRTIAGLVLIGLFAGAVIVRGADRISETRPSVARLVPAPFSVNAARERGRAALAAKDYATALMEAQRAVRNDPADARSVGLLGSVLLASGKNEAADRAFTVSAALGWREPATQLYWMGQALAAGDVKVASQRLDALLRQSPEFERRVDLLALLEAMPAGRTELAARLADKPAWDRVYFIENYLQSPMTRRNRAAIAEQLATLHKDRDCVLVGPLTFGLVGDGDVAGARRIWQLHCRDPGSQTLVADGTFSRATPDRPVTPFDWTWPEDPQVGVTLGPSTGFSGQAVSVSTTAPRLLPFARQILALAPGAYSISWRALTETGEPASEISPSVACSQDGAKPMAGSLVDSRNGKFTASFSVAADCGAQWLTFWIAPGGDDAVLDDVAILPSRTVPGA